MNSNLFEEQTSQKIRDVISRIKYLETLENVSVFVKNSTGLPATGRTGQIVINSVDETIHIYAFGSWQSMGGGAGGNIHNEEISTGSVVSLEENQVFIPGNDLIVRGNLDVGEGEVQFVGAGYLGDTVIAVSAGSGLAVPSTGVFFSVQIPFRCKLTSWTIESPLQSGSAVFDIWRGVYDDLPLTVAKSITGASKPTLSSAQKAVGTDLSDWDTSIAADEFLTFKLDSVTSSKLAILTLRGQR